MAQPFRWAALAWGSGLTCCNNGIHCVVPPPPCCPDCSPPCDSGFHRSTPWKLCRARQLIEMLSRGNCCDRIRAAEKLGHRWNADFCCDSSVLDALIGALQCDPCWEVRRAAACSLMLQGARVEHGVVALYVSSKMDPHYLVREKAAESLDILLVCRRQCFQDLFGKGGDELIKGLKAAKYKPGSENCQLIFNQCCGQSAGPAMPSAPMPTARRLPPATPTVAADPNPPVLLILEPAPTTTNAAK